VADSVTENVESPQLGGKDPPGFRDERGDAALAPQLRNSAASQEKIKQLVRHEPCMETEMKVGDFIGTHLGPQSNALRTSFGGPSLVLAKHVITPAIPATFDTEKAARKVAGIVTDGPAPALATVRNGDHFELWSVNVDNGYSASPYSPDALSDFGEVKVTFVNPDVASIVDGWTVIENPSFNNEKTQAKKSVTEW